MKTFRMGVCALALATAASVSACSSDEPPAGTPSTSQPAPTAGSGTSAGTPGTSGPAPTEPAASDQPTSAPAPTTSDQPVPKVERSKGASAPTVSAKPTTVDKPIRYSDGLSMRVVSVDFAKETKKGPGAFPGRAYAVLSLKVSNDSKKNLSMNTVVVTVLSKDDEPVAPVYTDEAKVQDFSGTLKAGKSAEARYAFAVPKSSRSKVTVVVDFDGAHTSAVFRGKLT